MYTYRHTDSNDVLQRAVSEEGYNEHHNDNMSTTILLVLSLLILTI